MSTHAEQLQAIVDRYRAAGQKWPATRKEIAAWALAKKEWMPSHASLLAQCAEELARAMREEYFTDQQGRRVRAKHAARIGEGPEQRTLWADIRTANREHMEIAFQQRRQQIVGDCRQLKSDVDSYNDNAAPKQPIQLGFDFTPDLEELEALESVQS
ncbi:MAG: hypothetical protein H6831_04470 [Planctomycetes bacterium]|nr:hypothetical protein [Planctomycetota bacterium]MCB9903643.1 hypothetical protein [Planctomycetota bacterium]